MILVFDGKDGHVSLLPEEKENNQQTDGSSKPSHVHMESLA
jgi:hypothetical protein